MNMYSLKAVLSVVLIAISVLCLFMGEFVLATTIGCLNISIQLLYTMGDDDDNNK